MFWDRFTALCIKNSKSPTAVVTELGISPASVTQWKNGANPRSKTIYKIANYFNVDPDDLSDFEPSIFYRNLCYLCSQNGDTPNSVALAIGCTSAAVTGWAAGRTPRDTTIRKISDYFGVSPDYLMGLSGDDKKTAAPKGDGLSDGAKRLVERYENASEEDRRRILAVVDAVVGEK